MQVTLACKETAAASFLPPTIPAAWRLIWADPVRGGGRTLLRIPVSVLLISKLSFSFPGPQAFVNKGRWLDVFLSKIPDVLRLPWE